MKNIIQALNAVMKDVSYVQKNSENKFHGYKYASESSLLESLRPAMIAHGLILIPSVGNVSPIDLNGNTTVTVDYTLAHTSGEVWPDKIVAVGCGNDKSKNGSVGDKGVYKALTGANKYLLFKLFQIETGDDPEKDEGEKPVPVAAKKEEPKKSSNSVIELPKGDLHAKDVDNYVEIFLGLVKMCMTAEQVRALWKQENDNRATLAILPNTTEFIKMTEASSDRIAELKGKK
jgi:hypothetical protein